MAILLEEEGLYDRARIYATDINEVVIQQARRQGSFRSTGCRSTPRTTCARAASARSREYYTAKYDGALFAPAPDAQHRVLAAQPRDRPLVREFNVILCRNVLIYFDETCRSGCTRSVLRVASPMFGYPRPGEQGVAAVHRSTRTATSSWIVARRSTGRSNDGTPVDGRRRRIVGRAESAPRDRARTSRAASRCRSRSCSIAARNPTAAARAAAGLHVAEGVRGGGQAADHDRLRLPRAAGLPLARRRRRLLADRRRAGALQPPVDRRDLRVGRRTVRPGSRSASCSRARTTTARGAFGASPTRGGVAIVQDPRTAESPIMPRAALRAVPARAHALARAPDAVSRLAGHRRRRVRRAPQPAPATPMRRVHDRRASDRVRAHRHASSPRRGHPARRRPPGESARAGGDPRAARPASRSRARPARKRCGRCCATSSR